MARIWIRFAPAWRSRPIAKRVGVYADHAVDFPIAIPAWKMAPALAFGNTVVLKPANPTPATAHALVAILHEAGAPAGIVNLVLGRGVARHCPASRRQWRGLHRLADGAA